MAAWHATDKDLPRIMEQMRACHANSLYADVPWDDEGAEQVTRWLMENGAVICNDTAFLALSLTPVHFNPTLKQAVEVGFYGKGGGELIEYARQWAKDNGAIRFVICGEDGPRKAGLDKWYKRRGLEPCATTYQEWL